MFVERGGARFLAHWIEYAMKSDRRTHVAVLKYVPTLLPRGAVAMGYEANCYGLSLPEAKAWLAAAGYTVVGEMD